MTAPASHAWRRRLPSGQSLSLSWDPDSGGEALLSIESDDPSPWRHHLSLAWRALLFGHAPVRVGAWVDAEAARELALSLGDFADDAGSLASGPEGGG